MTQKEQIREHLKANGSITWFIAVELYGIGRLASIIPKLVAEGMNIVPVTERNKKTRANWARYKLVK